MPADKEPVLIYLVKPYIKQALFSYLLKKDGSCGSFVKLEGLKAQRVAPKFFLKGLSPPSRLYYKTAI